MQERVNNDNCFARLWGSVGEKTCENANQKIKYSMNQLPVTTYVLLSLLLSAESAVLLDLLLSLPEELSHLDYKKLKGHMYKCYIDLTAHYKNEKSTRKAKISPLVNNNEDLPKTCYNVPSAGNSFSQEQEDISSTPSSTSGTASTSSTDWKTLGICPLNSFWFPLDILAQKKEILD